MSSRPSSRWRSNGPGIASAIVGMREAAHVEQNLRLTKLPPAGAEQIEALFKRSAAGRE